VKAKKISETLDFERNKDPQSSMGLGYSDLITFFIKLKENPEVEPYIINLNGVTFLIFSHHDFYLIHNKIMSEYKSSLNKYFFDIDSGNKNHKSFIKIAIRPEMVDLVERLWDSTDINESNFERGKNVKDSLELGSFQHRIMKRIESLIRNYFPNSIIESSHYYNPDYFNTFYLSLKFDTVISGDEDMSEQTEMMFKSELDDIITPLELEIFDFAFDKPSRFRFKRKDTIFRLEIVNVDAIEITYNGPENLKHPQKRPKGLIKEFYSFERGGDVKKSMEIGYRIFHIDGIGNYNKEKNEFPFGKIKTKNILSDSTKWHRSPIANILATKITKDPEYTHYETYRLGILVDGPPKYDFVEYDGEYYPIDNNRNRLNQIKESNFERKGDIKKSTKIGIFQDIKDKWENVQLSKGIGSMNIERLKNGNLVLVFHLTSFPGSFQTVQEIVKKYYSEYTDPRGFPYKAEAYFIIFPQFEQTFIDVYNDRYPDWKFTDN